MITKFKAIPDMLRKSALGLGTGAVLLAALPAVIAAQESADPLNLPDTINMLGENDPNMRRATARVNGFVITGTDVEHRVALVLDANDAQVSAEELQRLRVQVLRNLIDETLQIQEAAALEMPVETSDVDQSYNRVSSQNFGQNSGEMDAYLRRIGSSPESLKRQIQGELAWQRLLQRNIQPFVNVAEDEVNELLTRLNASKGSYEFRVGEIFLSSTSENRESVIANANQIVDQLRQGGSFVAYARQFSEASTAAVGGDLGWIRAGQLPVQLGAAVREMQPGQLAGPVEIAGGFSILYLIDRRQVLTADPRDAILSLKQISLDFPDDEPAARSQQRIEAFTAAVQQIRGCGDAENIATQIGAQVVANDQIRARSLPEALQMAMLDLQIGQATPPFGSVDEGVRVLMLCGRDDPEAEGAPSFDALMSQLEEERVNKRAQRYLRDLRRDAIIDYN